MKKILLSAILLLSSCVAVFSADKWDFVIVDGHKRDFKVHVPSLYIASNPAPLVIAMHGGGGRARVMERHTGFSKLSDKEGFIVVYPEGIEKQWNDGREVKQIKSQRAGIDDVAFISAMLDKLSVSYNINTKMIFAAGISNGGFMCQRLACELSGRFAAVVCVAATMPLNIKDSCLPKEKISVMFINGTADPLVPYEGGTVKVGRKEHGQVLSTAETVELWVKRNGCQKEKSDLVNADMNIERDFYRDKTGVAAVVLCTVKGGGHAWPGGTQYMPESVIGKVCRGFDATGYIWEFFKGHGRP